MKAIYFVPEGMDTCEPPELVGTADSEEDVPVSSMRESALRISVETALLIDFTGITASTQPFSASKAVPASKYMMRLSPLKVKLLKFAASGAVYFLKFSVSVIAENSRFELKYSRTFSLRRTSNPCLNTFEVSSCRPLLRSKNIVRIFSL